MGRRGKTIAKWGVLLALTTYAIVMCVWAGGEARARVCKGVEVDIRSDHRTISEQTVKDQLSTYGIIDGKRCSEINTQEIERHLSRCNNFEDVECAMTSDGHLRISVVPLVPEMRVFTGKGSYYVNRTGKWVESRPDFYVDVPVVKGKFSRKFLPTDLLPLTDYIRKDSLLKNLVTMVEVRSPEDIILVPRIKGHVINIGNVDNLKEKFTRLMLMYKKVMPYRGWNTYDTVSVKYDRMIVCSRRDKTIRNHGTLDLAGDAIEEENLAETTELPGASQSKTNTGKEETKAQEHKNE